MEMDESFRAMTAQAATRQAADALAALPLRALAASPSGVLLVQAEGRAYSALYANPAFYHLAGPAASKLSALIHADAVYNLLNQASKSGQPHTAKLQLGEHERQAQVVPVPGDPYCLILLLDDAEELSRCRAQLAYLANHDVLTGLPKRSVFIDRLQRAKAAAGRQGQGLAVLCLGMDNVHTVQAAHGHAAGEAMLVAVAARLQAGLGAHDSLCRDEGNAFLLSLGGVAGSAAAAQRCQALLQSLAAPVQAEGLELFPSCSIGLATYPADSDDGVALLRYAGMALTQAREQGGNQYHCYHKDLGQRAHQRGQFEAALHGAIARQELEMLYQPVADLQDGTICALEALVRWRHPTLGLVNARQFINLAEEIGLIGQIGDWVLARACQDLQVWRAAGLTPPRMGINLSPRQFHDPALAHRIAHILATHDIGPEQISLEITEAALGQDPVANGAALARLKDLGLAITLDDFGSGASALGHLHRYPLDLVKIDCALTRQVASGAVDAALSQAIIAMAHHMGIQVVAEGVETEGQCDFLRRNMCDQVQGHFFSLPLGALEIGSLLRDQRSLPAHLLRIQQRKRTLLLVDDESNIVSSLKRLLRRDEYHILTANNGTEGLAVLSRNAVDVIVSDQRMPGMLGVDFLRAAKNLYPDTIRIMLSGYTELQSVTDAVNEGAIYKFLTKPWEDELLRGHIAEAFRVKEIADDNERLHLELRTANHELAGTNRKMEELLSQTRQQISRDTVSLQVTRELLQFLPLPVIGLDDDGLIAFLNVAAGKLLAGNGAMLGREASLALPELFAAGADQSGPHSVHIQGRPYTVHAHVTGTQSASRGQLITLMPCELPHE